MAKAKASIYLTWSESGLPSHRLDGTIHPGARNNPIRWVIGPSAPLLLTHQLGVMKPAQGLITCSRVFDMLFTDRYILMPINTALQGARIDMIYGRDQSAYIQFHPKHSFLANNDSLEEGARQLINNYFYYVQSLLKGHDLLVVNAFGCIAIRLWLEVLRTLRAEGSLPRGVNRWLPSFSMASASNQYAISTRYIILDDTNGQENEEWAMGQIEWLNNQRIELSAELDEMSAFVGIR